MRSLTKRKRLIRLVSISTDLDRAFLGQALTTVSVIIPTYNGSAFLLDCLSSVFRQTQPPDEIIVVDDCSKDGTASMVAALARDSPVPLRVIPLVRNSGGPSRPLNVG